jgi:hypothetical protein
VEIATDEEWAGLDDERMEPRPLATGRVAAWTCRPHGDQAVPCQYEAVVPRQPAVRQSLDLGVDERQLRVRIQEVGQSIGREPHPAVDPVVDQEGIEADERRVDDRLRFAGRLGRPLQDEVAWPGGADAELTRRSWRRSRSGNHPSYCRNDAIDDDLDRLST